MPASKPPQRNNYRRGYLVERQAIQLLTRQGYICMRASSSKGPFDLVAWREGEPCRHIQVKREKKSTNHLYPTLRRLLAQVPCSRGGSRELWIWSDTLHAWRLQLVILSEEDYLILHQVVIPPRRSSR